MFNLKHFDSVSQANEGAELHLTNPLTGELAYIGDDESMPVKIRLLGYDSDVSAKEAQKKAKALRRKNNSNDIDIDKMTRESCELYARLTVELINVPAEESTEKKFVSRETTFEECVKLYMNYKEIRKQVGDFIADNTNFIKD